MLLSIGDALVEGLILDDELVSDGLEVTCLGSSAGFLTRFRLDTPPFWRLPFGIFSIPTEVTFGCLIVVLYQCRKADNFLIFSATATVWLQIFKLSLWGQHGSHINWPLSLEVTKWEIGDEKDCTLQADLSLLAAGRRPRSNSISFSAFSEIPLRTS